MKKINFTKEWCMRAAQDEGSSDVGAGVLAHLASPSLEVGPPAPESETRIAFARVIQLLRRQKGLSVEQLADEANVELGDLVSIEEDRQRVPGPRTVFQLAEYFKVPPKSLLQLSGLTMARDATIEQEAVRFAARSEPVAKLTREETAALETFISVLSKRG